MGQLSLRLLGNWAGTLGDGTPLRLPTKKYWALVAYLVLQPGQSADRETLASILWSDRPREQARRSVRQALHELRAALGDDTEAILGTARGSASLRVEDVDALNFARLAESRTDEGLARAERLYRGMLLEGMATDDAAFDAWLVAERARLHDLARHALASLATRQLKSRDGEAALATARRCVEIDSFEEAGHRLVMRALAECGRRNEALIHFKELQDFLRKELGVAPAHETTTLRDTLRQGIPARDHAGGDDAVSATGKPTIAVLPFETLSTGPGEGTFARGLTEDVVGALCKVPQLTTVSAGSLRGDSDEQRDERRTAEELGVRYLLKGSVRGEGGKFRITVRLVDATGIHVWGDRFDREATEFLSLQDELVHQILVALEIKLGSGEMARLESRGTKNLDAWLLRVQAEDELWKFTRASTKRTRELYSAARDLDPAWPLPWACLAWTHWFEAKQGWAASRPQAISAGIALAEKAIALGPNEPVGYMQLGNLVQLQGHHERAIALRERAVRLAPSDFAALCGFGSVLLRAGHPTRALSALKRAAEVAPRYPPSLLWLTAAAHLVAGNSDAAADTATRAIASKPDNPDAYALAAMAFVGVGRVADARECVDSLLRIDPSYRVADWKVAQDVFRDRAAVDRLAGLLVQAGLAP